MAHHEIEIKLTEDDDGGLHAMPTPSSAGMQLKDTVSYVCTDGAFRVVFEKGSPYDDPSSNNGKVEIKDSNNRVVTKRGHFTCKCFIKKDAASKEIGWREDEKPQSGGDHNVPPNPN